MVSYQSDQQLDTLAAAARRELPPSEWLERSQPGQFAFFDNDRLGKSVLLIKEDSGIEITIGQSRPATILDKFRLWFRAFGQQRAANLTEVGSPLNDPSCLPVEVPPH